MKESPEILITVHYRHAANMLNGTKTAEVRRRAPRIEPGTRIWVYTKLPRGRVELVARVAGVIEASPHELWSRYRSRIAISRTEFREYLSGTSRGCVILLKEIKPLANARDLATMRKVSRNFHPPQFFKRLLSHGPEIRSLLSSVNGDHKAWVPAD